MLCFGVCLFCLAFSILRRSKVPLLLPYYICYRLSFFWFFFFVFVFVFLLCFMFSVLCLVLYRGTELNLFIDTNVFVVKIYHDVGVVQLP